MELLVRRTDDDELTLDLDSVVVNGRRYGIEAEDIEVRSRRDSLGFNERTGKYVGGGAVLGAIIGAIAGGGKGAAIGTGAGAAAGAGTQILTRGRRVPVGEGQSWARYLLPPEEGGPKGRMRADPQDFKIFS